MNPKIDHSINIRMDKMESYEHIFVTLARQNHTQIKIENEKYEYREKVA